MIGVPTIIGTFDKEEEQEWGPVDQTNRTMLKHFDDKTDNEPKYGLYKKSG